MTRAALAILVAWLPLAAAAVLAAEPPSVSPPQTRRSEGGELAAEVDRLVAQLDARERSLRMQAESRLLALGTDVLPLLPEPEDARSAEVRNALRRIRRTLEIQSAKRDLAASLVNLEADAIPLSKALAEISRETGNELRDLRSHLGQPTRDPELHVRFQGTPFWQALDEICRQAGLVYQPYAGGRYVGLMAAPGVTERHTAPVSYSGPFRLTAERWEVTQDLAQPDSRNYRLHLQVMWEPRLRPFFLALPMDRVSGTDDLGHEVVSLSTGAQYEASADPHGIAVEMDLDLAPPDRRAQRVVELRGRLVAQAAGRIETFRMRAVQEAPEPALRQGPIELTLQAFHRSGSLWEARLRLRYDSDLPAFDSHRSWVFSNEIYLERADGTRIDAIPGSNVDFPAPGTVDVSYQFSGAPEGTDTYALVYQAPSLVVEVPVDFTFHDLPLP